MLGSNNGTVEKFSFQIGNFQCFFGLFYDRDIGHIYTGFGMRPDSGLQLLTKLIYIHPKGIKDLNAYTFTVTDHSKDQVFSSYIVMTKSDCLFSAISKY